MLDLEELLCAIQPILQVKIGLFREIIKGIYSISSGGVTMKNISRWTGSGCSYRNIQRFFASPHDWLAMNVQLLRTVIFGIPDSNRYVLAVDEVVEKKAGRWTWGVNWFYSSIAGRPIRLVSNHVVSLVDTEKEHSFVLTHRQTTKESSTTQRSKKKRKKKQSQKGNGKSNSQKKSGQYKKAGRPKGSKNKQNIKQEGLLYEGFEALLKLVVPLLLVICPCLKYVIGDGAYGNKTCCLIAREVGLELISKLNRNTGLYLPYQGEYSGRGRPRKYGDKLDYQKLPKQYLVSTNIEKGIRTDVYQIAGVWTKTMPYLINVVIIIKTILESGKSARVVLFSTDLALQAEQIVLFP